MYFPGAPFLGAGILVVAAAIVFAFTAWRFDLMHRPRVSKREHHHDLAPPGQQATPPHEDDDPSDFSAPRMH
jgi:DHA1 family tetracycline resistance protein-like MFS transporter